MVQTGHMVYTLDRTHGLHVSAILHGVGGIYAMPWKETELVNLRAQFVEAAEAHLFDMTTLCKEYGISRPTGYKWLRRHEDDGDDDLADRSRAPHNLPNRPSRRLGGFCRLSACIETISMSSQR